MRIYLKEVKQGKRSNKGRRGVNIWGREVKGRERQQKEEKGNKRKRKREKTKGRERERRGNK